MPWSSRELISQCEDVCFKKKNHFLGEHKNQSSSISSFTLQVHFVSNSFKKLQNCCVDFGRPYVSWVWTECSNFSLKVNVALIYYIHHKKGKADWNPTAQSDSVHSIHFTSELSQLRAEDNQTGIL